MRKLVAPVIGLLSLVASLAVSALAASPVSAHPAHGAFVDWRSPEDGDELAGRDVHIRARLSFGGDGVKSYTVEVLAPEANSRYPGFGTICDEAVAGSPLTVDVDCPWDTTVYPDDGSIAWNGEYVVRISAVNGTNRGAFGPKSESHQDERTVSVLNDVSPPRNVHLSFSEAGRQANVDWDANPEPDVTSYTIQERVGDQAWKTVGQAGAKITSFTRQLSAPGTYHYQVAAIRDSGTDADPVQSAWTGPSSEPKEIVVAEPTARPATTSTSGPDAAAEPFVPGADPSPGPPAEGGPGAPLTGAGSPDGAARADGSRTAFSSPGNLVTRVQPGKPGSVQSHEVSGGRLVDRGAAPNGPAPEPDEPFSEQLPYKKPPAAQNPPPADGIAGTLVSLPRTIPTDSRRDMVIPLAAGLLLFVFAMHALYLSRRSAPESPLDLE